MFLNMRNYVQRKKKSKDLVKVRLREREKEKRDDRKNERFSVIYAADDLYQTIPDGEIEVADKTSSIHDPSVSGFTHDTSEVVSEHNSETNEPEEKCTIKGVVISIVSFTLHFMFVMGMLFGGALGFAYFEDPESFMVKGPGNDTSGNGTIVSDAVRDLMLVGETNRNQLWVEVENRYNLSLESNEKEEMMKLFSNFISKETELNDKIAYKKLHTKKFTFLKWFYFVTIATTTIGYGDVSPSTDNGKYFYMFFSVIGVILMMALLARCGSVISYVNTSFFNLLKKYLFRGNMDGNGKEPFISSELLTSITILMIFGGYLYAGIWYGQNMAKVNWSPLDTIYFWIVTFTTVGFGDILHPLEKEVENIYFFVIYRIFGLAFLAAIIDALSAYAEYKSAIYMKKIEEQKKKLKEKMNDNLTHI